jgi:predicted NBD/HSP70 family sugar kinase
VGYVDGKGHVTGWLNELAFAPVDYAEGAPCDSEWSGDFGTGVNYFSQDAVIRLAPRLGIQFNAADAPGTKLKQLQTRFKNGETRLAEIFETIGTYLGYAILQYAEFYELRHVLILGRVSSGEGGNIILAQCKKVMAAEEPVLSRRISVNLPDEASRRVGQAIAAASLPEIKKFVLNSKAAKPGAGGPPARPAKKRSAKKKPVRAGNKKRKR